MRRSSSKTETPTVAIDSFESLTPEVILAAIEAQPGLHTDGSLLPLNSYENRVYRVGIEDSSPLVAKFYRPARWTKEQIDEEHQFAQELANAEIPVVSAIPDQNGETTRQNNGFFFSLYPMRGGRSPELDNKNQLEIIGRFIGRIHKVGEVKSFAHRATVDISTLGYSSANYLLDNDRLPADLANAYESLVTEIFAKVEERFTKHQTLPSLRLHGDFHPGNILWRDETPHIVDLDDSRTGPAIQDIWLFLSGNRDYQQARLEDLLKGYTQFREFDPRELNLIEALRTLRMIHYAAWLDMRREEPAFQQAFPWLYTARFWDDHILELKEQSSDLDLLPLEWV